MAENEIIDNEIIRDLKCCIDGRSCYECIYRLGMSKQCIVNLMRDALALIKRQKAEIERLKTELHGKVEYIHEQREVIDEKKEEIEKLKKPLQKLKEIGYCHNFQLERSDLVSWIYAVCNVIKVANKMTEDENG